MTDALGQVDIGNVKHRIRDGTRELYCGRGRTPAGMEHAHLGNPFVVGRDFAQGQAAGAYLPHLQRLCRRDTSERRTILRLAALVRGGVHIRLMCWCKHAPQDPGDVPCHCDHIRAAVLGYARRIQ